MSAAQPSVSLLIIDDNLSSLEILSEALAQSGLEILTASDPEEVLIVGSGVDHSCSRSNGRILIGLLPP